MEQILNITQLNIGRNELTEDAPNLDPLPSGPGADIAHLRGILPGHRLENLKRAPVSIKISGCRPLTTANIAHHFIRIHDVLSSSHPKFVSAPAVCAQEISAPVTIGLVWRQLERLDTN